ncbi:hypothetical protein KZ810_03675 [Sphingomonas sp. RHCKR47]|uniref:hypothetical protein n=1 Tax=Sphingomonas citricola TaxID=2862498 RepID=UPI001CA50E32|nr:hypothetical protein [Sphingomonas citricola]MBW6522587.1 hypothetical protein [Sphingomonas citricola]
MYDVTIPVLDAPVAESATPAQDDAAMLLALHRNVLETIRSTIERCAHPGCPSCHEIAVVLDDYLSV